MTRESYTVYDKICGPYVFSILKDNSTRKEDLPFLSVTCLFILCRKIYCYSRCLLLFVLTPVPDEPLPTLKFISPVLSGVPVPLQPLF